MSPTILQTALGLPARDRAALADALLASLDDLPPDELDAAWAAEAQRRSGELASGVAVGVPAAEVFAAMRDRLR